MDLEMVARTIQLIIAPAVMITACCIFGAGLLGHYSSIGERLRLTVREKVDLLRETYSASGASLIIKARLEDIDDHIPTLLRHHLLIRTSLAGTLIAMIFYIIDMFVIAFSVIANRSGLYGVIIIIFMLGVASQLTGVIYAVFDVLILHKIYAFEARPLLVLGTSEIEPQVR
jgi:Protein of unknown function (DUF2721)